MKTKHVYDLVVKDVECPVDGEKIEYEVTLESSQKILVEDILEFFDTIKTHPIFQEDLVSATVNHFGCEVIINGEHSGVSIWSSQKP